MVRHSYNKSPKRDSTLENYSSTEQRLNCALLRASRCNLSHCRAKLQKSSGFRVLGLGFRVSIDTWTPTTLAKQWNELGREAFRASVEGCLPALERGMGFRVLGFRV